MKTRRSSQKKLTLAAAITLSMFGATASAQTTWTASIDALWSTPGNWDTSFEPTAADNVVLPLGLPGTIMLATGELANSLTIQDNYTLSGGNLTLTGGGIDVAAGSAGVIGSALNGTAGLTKTGAGSLTLLGTNLFTGGTTINGGTLIVNADGRFGAVPGSAETNITINGAALQVNSAFTIGANRQIAIGTGGATIAFNAATGNLNMASVIKDAGPGAGALTLTATGTTLFVPQAQNTYSGGTHLTAGTRLVQNVASIGSATTNDLLSGPLGTGTLFFDGGQMRASTTAGINTIGNALQFTADTTFISGSTQILTFNGPATLVGNRTITTNHTGNVVFSGIIGDGGGGNSLTIGATSTAASVVVLEGANTYTGATIIDGGILRIGHGGTTGSLSPSSAITNNTTLQFNRTNTYTQGVDFGTITGAGGISLLGSGTLALTSSNPADLGIGTITINNAAGSIRSHDATARTITNPIILGTNYAFGSSGTGNLTFTGDVNVGTIAKTFNVQNAQTEFSGVISSTGTATQTKTGPGTLVFSGANTYTGNTTVTGGTLSLEGANGSIQNSAVLTVGTGTTLQIVNSAAGNNADRILDTAPISMSTAAFNFLHDSAAGANYSETAGAVTYAVGSNTIETSQAASGQTSTLTLAAVTRSGTATMNFIGPGLGVDDRNKLLITGQAVGNIVGNTTYNTNDYAAYSATNGVTVADYTDINALGSVIPNTAGATVRINGLGSGANTTLAAASTTINALLQNSTDAATINNAGQALITSGIMIPAGKGALTIGAAVGDGSILRAPASGGVLYFTNNSANPLTINSIFGMNGTNPVMVTGTGEVVFAGANTYNGTTTISNGNLTLAGTRTAALAQVSVGTEPGATGTLNITGNFLVSAAVGIRVGNGAGTTGVVNHTSGTFNNSGVSDIILIGLTGGTGIYNFSGGTISGSSTSAIRGIVLGSNANATSTFNMSGTAEINLPTAPLQVGRFDSAQNNTINTYNQTGGSALVGSLGIGGATGGSTGVTANFSVTSGTFSAAAFPALAGGNTNTATMLIGGTAVVTLPAFPTARGTNSTATLTFDGGTLVPTEASATYLEGLTNAFLTNNGAKLDVGSGNDITVAQALLDADSQNGTLTKLGPGKLTLTGENTYTGNTTVSAGTLALDTTGSIAASPVINVAALATLDVSTVTGGFTLGTAQTLAGSGTVAGNVTLAAGANLSPGTSPGNLTFTGNLDLTATGGGSGGDLVFELGTLSDLVTLTGGTLSIGSSLGFNDFAFTAGAGFGIGTYTLFDSSAPIVGTLDSANLTGLIGALYTGTLEFADGGNDIVLTVEAIPEPSTLVLAGLGVLGFAGLHLRRRRMPA